ncbi:MAG: hypothetical protein H0Z38_01975 [Firmicutes bacterium]|nr:hypothetical protein [Bacillota bacterium]
MSFKETIRDFLASYSEALDATIEPIKEGVFRLETGDESLTYTFDPTIAGLEGVEYLTFGHPALDRMIARGRAQGQTAHLFLPLNNEQMVQFKDALNSIPLLRYPALPTAVRLVYQPLVVFNFHLALLADLRREEVVALAVDPETGQVRLWQLPADAVSFSRGFSLQPDRRKRPRSKDEYITSDLADHIQRFQWLKETKYSLYRLYKAGCQFLKEWINRRYATFETEQVKRLEEEKATLDHYYQGLLDEEMASLYQLLHKAAVLEVRVALAKREETRRQFSQELEAVEREISAEKKRCQRVSEKLAAEKSKRLHELATKYLPKARIRLVSAAYVYLPRAQVNTVYYTPNFQGSTVFTYDFHQDRWLPLACEVCGEEVPALVIGHKGEHLCLRCALCCEVCRGFFTPHPADECSACGRRLCPQCAASCRVGNPAPCGLCLECASQICSDCSGLTGGSAFPGRNLY